MKNGIVIGTLGISAVGAWLLWPHQGADVPDRSTASGETPAITLSPSLSATGAQPGDAGLALLLSSEKVGLAKRLQGLSMISATLTDEDRGILLRALTASMPSDITEGDWHAIVNDMMQSLRSQKEPSPELTDALIALWRDKHANETLRDYALQHLREWVADGDSRSTHEQRPEKLRSIRQCMWEAAQASTNPSSITALLAWNEWVPAPNGQTLEIERGSVDSATIDALALRFAQGDEGRVFRGTQVSALQICARRGVKEALETARKITGDTSADVTLRLSSIAAMGSLGSQEDARLLREVKSANHPTVLDPALNTALRRLDMVAQAR